MGFNLAILHVYIVICWTQYKYAAFKYYFFNVPEYTSNLAGKWVILKYNTLAIPHLPAHVICGH